MYTSYIYICTHHIYIYICTHHIYIYTSYIYICTHHIYIYTYMISIYIYIYIYMISIYIYIHDFHIYIYISYASEASFCRASTLFETKGLKLGSSIALPKSLPPVAMMAQKFHQEMFLGVSGFFSMILYDTTDWKTMIYQWTELQGHK